jgi:hypothetical protein
VRHWKTSLTRLLTSAGFEIGSKSLETDPFLMGFVWNRVSQHPFVKQPACRQNPIGAHVVSYIKTGELSNLITLVKIIPDLSTYNLVKIEYNNLYKVSFAEEYETFMGFYQKGLRWQIR